MIFEKQSKLIRLRMLRTAFVFGVSLFFSFSLFGQKTKALLADGDKAFAENDFFSAAAYYNRAILQDSSDIIVQYKYADASRLNFDYAIAEHCTSSSSTAPSMVRPAAAPR